MFLFRLQIGQIMFVCLQTKMHQELMTPVQEVALYLHRNNVQRGINHRTATAINQFPEQHSPVPPQSGSTKANSKMDVEQSALEQSGAATAETLIDLAVSSDDDEATMDYGDDDVTMGDEATMYPEPAAVPIAVAAAIPVAVPAIAPKDPIVPKTIENLWQAVESMHYGALEPPTCPCEKCPYNCGARYVPLMRQRYDLMQRLVELERQLYGI